MSKLSQCGQIAALFIFTLFSSPLRGDPPATSDLVDIQTVIPSIQVELRYATTNNFTKEVLYPFHHCYLIREAAMRLAEVQEELKASGLGLKVWDGYRPMSVQKKLWDLVQDERYIVNPKKGGRHTRGTAVDLTLVDKNGKELVMPTPFDEFTERAHRDYMKTSKEAIANRALLEQVMQRHCFVGMPTEWWHFDLVGWENYPPLDVNPEHP